MLGQSSQTYIYEVTGLRQNRETQNRNHQFRNSSVLIKVPLSRMNAETQRITRLGGKIVSIRPASDYSSGTKGVVGTIGGNRQKLYRVRVTKSSLARTAKVRASISEYLIPYEQLSSALKRFNQKGSKVLNVSPA